MKKLEPYQIYEDDRGKLIGLMNQKHWEEFNYLETKAGNTRGNHFHKETHELFFIIDGKGRIDISPVNGESYSTTFIKGDIILIEPDEVHTFHCETETRWINFLTKRFDSSNPDFHQLEKI